MTRARRRRGHNARTGWPLSVEAELATGHVDLTAFRSTLARIYAWQAQRALTPPHLDPEHARYRLELARHHEAAVQHVYAEVDA